MVTTIFSQNLMNEYLSNESGKYIKSNVYMFDDLMVLLALNVSVQDNFLLWYSVIYVYKAHTDN